MSGFLPDANGTGTFGTSSQIFITVSNFTPVGGWAFASGASNYIFTLQSELEFFKAGISINGSKITLDNFATLVFDIGSTAGGALIINEKLDVVEFNQVATAGNSTINNSGFLRFFNFSTAGNANINNFSAVFFNDHSTAGGAAINNIAGTVDFSFSSGPFGDGNLTAGSIAGAGTFDLGGVRLKVGSNNATTTVSGPVDDGGANIGTHGASLVKVGIGTLTLSHAGNTYSGGTTLERGGLEVAAVGAAGTGDIEFAGKAKLKIDNAALSSHVFANSIDLFGKTDILDLTGLKFHPGASARYHAANEHLRVHSGHVTDILTLVSPHGTHFTVANDGHGGTKVVLHPPFITVTAASLTTHDLGGEPLSTDGASHSGDFLFTA
jgi:autotransporter-associated beta strand protein